MHAVFSLADQTVRGARSYAEACTLHAWKVPALYNIAWDISERHADGARALVWHSGEGDGASYTFGDLKRLSARLAAGLAALGLDRGSRAALMLPQTPEHAAAHIAIFKLGAISVPLSRLFGPEALRYRLGDSGARVLLTDGENLGKVLEIWTDLPELRYIVLCDRQPRRPDERRVLTFAEVLARGSNDFPMVETRAEDPALLI